MILTEEQRGALAHAINYIDETDLPVGELDGFDREVLRAMIDSSDPIPDVTELVELLAAGEHEQWAGWAQAILDSEPGLSDGRKAAWPGMIATPYENLSEEPKDKDRREVHLRSGVALDHIQQQSIEIERLRGDNAGLSKAVIDIQEERDLAQAEFRAYHKAWEEGAAWIKELEELNAALMKNESSLRTAAAKYRKRAQAAEAKIGTADECPDDLPPIGSPYHISDELRYCHSCGKSIDEVKGNLCKGDYFIGSIFLDPGQEASRFDPPIDASYYFSCCDCARSWQITDERILAIENAISSCVLIERYTGQDLQHETAVLRGMLEGVA